MSQRNLIILVVAVLAVIGVGYLWYQQANPPAPAVSVEAPVTDAAPATAADAPADDASTDAAPEVLSD